MKYCQSKRNDLPECYRNRNKYFLIPRKQTESNNFVYFKSIISLLTILSFFLIKCENI